MSNPLLSIIIPTHNRPHLLPRAVQSALAQTIADLEVIVVEASTAPVNLPESSRLRIIRLPADTGIAAARNAGAQSARGRWLTYLDDDDQLLPHMAAVSLEALAQTRLPKPVAVLSGTEIVDESGQLLQTRLPPRLPQNLHFSLAEIEPEQSFFSKQTLVVERKVLLRIGGYDEAFTYGELTELFLRLTPICSILGLPIVTYRQFQHNGPRSANPTLCQMNFQRLVCKHESLFKAQPKMFTHFVYEHARRLAQCGQRVAAFSTLCWAIRLDAPHTSYRVALSLLRRAKQYTLRVIPEHQSVKKIRDDCLD